ncbi:MAG TPA: ABC transporter permease [Candidatus Bilamarchaeaceae archaeon]|nr:ABC transporter permease [Candidatus Bilamarchaeaceae archaeon]
MKTISMFFHAYKNLTYRGVQSWLTILGIIVGISSIVTLVGLVEGLKSDITSQLDSFGPRTFMVVPTDVSSGFQGASSFLPTSGKLFQKDFDRLKRISAIDSIAKVIIGRSFVNYKNKDITASVYGIDPEIFSNTVGSLEIESGRFLLSSDKKSVVVGADIANDGFDKKIELGSIVKIADEEYKVVGILRKTGNSFAQLDNVFFIQFNQAEKLFEDQLSPNEISAIRITIRDSYDLDEVEDEITSVLLSSHHVSEDEKDFGIVSPKFITEQINQITGILSIFLGAIAGVSLIVGGIGISNSMFMSVLKRKKEIGLLKSLGLKDQELLQLFIIESSMIGFFGGVLGVIVAHILAFLINSYAGISFVMSIPLLIFALLFSAFVGIVSGTIPARRAARLDPVEALRYE